MPRKRENKNYFSAPFRSYPTRNRKFEKNSKKIQKIIKYYDGFISSQNKGGNGKKNYRSVLLQPDAKKKIPKK